MVSKHPFGKVYPLSPEDRKAFKRTVDDSGQVGAPDAQGKLAPGVTHERLKDGKIKRRRFSLS